MTRLCHHISAMSSLIHTLRNVKKWLWRNPVNTFDNKPVVSELCLYGAGQSDINSTLLTHGAEGVKTASICCLCAVPVSFSPQSQEGRSVHECVVVVYRCVCWIGLHMGWHVGYAALQSQTSIRS